MNKLHVFIIISALGLAAVNADAFFGCRRNCNEPCEPKRCEKKCEPVCAPKCTERSWIVQEPCKKWVLVEGTCDHRVCERCCTTTSKKCISGCHATCENAVYAKDRNEGAEERNYEGSEE